MDEDLKQTLLAEENCKYDETSDMFEWNTGTAIVCFDPDSVGRAWEDYKAMNANATPKGFGMWFKEMLKESV